MGMADCYGCGALVEVGGAGVCAECIAETFEDLDDAPCEDCDFASELAS